MTQPPPSVLHATRLQRGWTQAELASVVGIGQTTISKLEAGLQRPEPDLADALARALDIAVVLLGQLDPSPHIGHLLKPSLARVARNRALADVTLAHAHIDLLLSAAPSDLYRDPGSMTRVHPHTTAEIVRSSWRVPPGPINGLIPLLESLGIVCVYRDLRQLGVSALSSTAEGDRVLMLLHSGAGTLDLAWAVAHELGHLLFTGDPAKDEELHADAFAAAFLMPGRELLGDEKLGPDVDLADAAATWGVRPRALAQRLRDLRKVTDLQFRGLVHDAQGLSSEEARISLLGAPTMLADAVRDLGGSRAAASRALLGKRELWEMYLAGSRR